MYRNSCDWTYWISADRSSAPNSNNVCSAGANGLRFAANHLLPRSYARPILLFVPTKCSSGWSFNWNRSDNIGHYSGHSVRRSINRARLHRCTAQHRLYYSLSHPLLCSHQENSNSRAGQCYGQVPRPFRRLILPRPLSRWCHHPLWKLTKCIEYNVHYCV